MPSPELLISLVGQPVESPSVQALIRSERLQSSAEEDMEEGEPVQSYLTSYHGGYQLVHSLGRISTLFIYVTPKDGFAACISPLPYDLLPQSTRSDVRQRLGMPTRSGAAQSLPPLGRYGPWDRFDGTDLCLHVQYTESNERIELITIMTVAAAP